jgi:DNA-binding LacI/PurR family transcriptional regulator
MSPSIADVSLLERFSVPVVLVDAQHPQFASVSENSLDGGRKATRHLINLGHRRIAFIGGPLQDMFNFTNTSTSYRLRGYQAALAEAGISPRQDFIVIDPRAIGEESRDSAREQTRALLALPEPPTAIFTASDTQAMGVLQAAQEMGLSVPRDLSVIGYDDIEVARFLQLTTVRQNLMDSGRSGARLLLEMLSQEEYHPVLEQIPNEVIERNTTAAPSTSG